MQRLKKSNSFTRFQEAMLFLFKRDQAWAPQFLNNKNKSALLSTNAQLKFATVGPSRGPLKGVWSALKSPSRVREGDEGVTGRNGREKCLPNDSITFLAILPAPNIWLLAYLRLNETLTQLSNLWWMWNSVSKGFDTNMKTGSSRWFKRYPTTYMWVSSWHPFTVD